MCFQIQKFKKDINRLRIIILNLEIIDEHGSILRFRIIFYWHCFFDNLFKI